MDLIKKTLIWCLFSAADYPDVEIVLGPGGMHAMQPEQLEVVWGISKEYLRKSFGPIANKVVFVLFFE